MDQRPQDWNMTPSATLDARPAATFRRGPRLLLAGLVAVGACKLMDEGLNNDQIKEFREKGQAAGAGLNVPEAPSLGPATETVAPPVAPPVATGGGVVEELVVKRSRCGADVACARELLGEVRALGHAADQPLIALLAERYPTEVRVEAIRVLAFLRVGVAVPALGRLVNDQRPDVQRESVWALGQIRDVRAVETLSRVLTSSPRLELRDAAAQALGSLRDPEAAEALIAAWKGAEAKTKAPIVSALGQIGDPIATKVLIEALRSRDDVTRLEAINGLEAVGALEPKEGRKARAALAALAADPTTSPLVKRRALSVLGPRDPDAPPDPEDASPPDEAPDDVQEP